MTEATSCRTDVLVVGAGPAGWAAATELARAGVRVVVADENQRPGGQIDRQRFVDPDEPVAGHPRVDVRGGLVCHGFDQAHRAVFSGRRGACTVEAAAVVLATGAVENVLPVPGWTLPGVLTAGAAQTFLKGSGVLPYRRVLVAGTGPLLLAVAAQLAAAGVRLAGVLEAATPTARQWRAALRLTAQPTLLADGAGYLARLAAAGVSPRTGVGVRRVAGTDAVTGAWVGRLRRDWSFADRPAEFVECDAVLLSHGFSSTVELAGQAGAAVEWDDQRNTWRPCRDDAFRTSVPRVLAVGDCAGVGGAQRARHEGRLAGLLLAAELTGRPVDGRRVRRLRARLARLETFRAGMDELFRPGPGVATWPTADTQVCRCQETTRADIDDALAHGVTDLRGLKLWTRAGMGPCQARSCVPVLRALLAEAGIPPGAVPPPNPRFPVRPLPVRVFAAGACHDTD